MGCRTFRYNIDCRYREGRMYISGSKTLEHEFDELDEEEAEHRLRLLAMKMDRNGDGHVDKDELTHWIIMSYEYLHFSSNMLQMSRHRRVN